MGYRNRSDSFHLFYRPFYDTQKGHIVGLATTRENMRDGLAIAHIARFFPLPEFDHIVVEPGRRPIQPGENVILVGWSSLFVDPKARPRSGDKPVVVGKATLGERLEHLRQGACYRITNRRVINGLTGQRFDPTPHNRPNRKGLMLDYGVIRRQFRGPTENTIVLEGVQRLGTLGAAKVATDRSYLDAIVEGIRDLDDFDESLPLEILVQTTFRPTVKDDIFSLATIHAIPLAMVYNGQWVYKLSDGSREWTDQLPWDIQLAMAEEDSPRPALDREIERAVPRLEACLDARMLDERVRDLCRELLSPETLRRLGERPATDKSVTRLIEELTRESDHFEVRLSYAPRGGAPARELDLPKGYTPIRRTRKKFLVHLILSRLWNRGFRYDSRTIRRIFPRYKPALADDALVGNFVAAIPGRMREGFEALLGPARKKKNYVQIDSNKAHKTYTLRLDRAALVVKLRL